MESERLELTRFRIEFADADDVGLPAEVGVTARDATDAIDVIRAHWRIAPDTPVRASRCVVAVDVSELPQWVRAGVGVPVWRGVWYPVSGIDP